MREFFRGWKRKVGVVTLGIACITTALWLRGIDTFEHAYVPCGKLSLIYVSSWNGSLSVGLAIANDPEYFPTKPDWYRIPSNQEHFERTFLNAYSWVVQFGEFRVGVRTFNPPQLTANMVIAVPHWSIAIPMTLISAWCLLSKSKPQVKPLIAPPAKLPPEPSDRPT